PSVSTSHSPLGALEAPRFPRRSLVAPQSRRRRALRLAHARSRFGETAGSQGSYTPDVSAGTPPPRRPQSPSILSAHPAKPLEVLDDAGCAGQPPLDRWAPPTAGPERHRAAEAAPPPSQHKADDIRFRQPGPRWTSGSPRHGRILMSENLHLVFS